MKKITTIIIILATAFAVNAQNNIGIGTSPNASAKLDVSSTTQGMLVPRMTAAQRTAITTPATGLMVYQTDATAGFQFYNGTAWTSLNGASGPAGVPGATGATGPTGPVGATGTNGQGVPTGGAANQVLAKVNATDFNTQWVTPTPGNATVDLVVSKTSGSQTLANANGTNTGDLVTFDNVIKTPTIGTYNTGTNTYTVGTSGYYYIQVRSVSPDVSPTPGNTIGNWYKVEIDPVGATGPSFVNDRDVYGIYPQPNGNNFPSGLKGRSELQGVVFLNAGDSFVIKGLSANSTSPGSPIKTDGSCKLTVVKLN